MRFGDSLRTAESKGRRAKKAALYRVIVEGAFELGEVARFEVEIQKLFFAASEQPRCPCWHSASPPSRQVSKPH
jgi:hypothetical protein